LPPFLLLLVLLLPTPARSKPPKKLTLPQLVQAAERFIAINGYTDVPPARDRTKLTPEFISPGVGQRRNTLERKAYGYVKGRRGSKTGWTVVFRFRKHSGSKSGSNGERELGRAVTMDAAGRGICVEHVNAILNGLISLGQGKAGQGKTNASLSSTNL